MALCVETKSKEDRGEGVERRVAGKHRQQFVQYRVVICTRTKAVLGREIFIYIYIMIDIFLLDKNCSSTSHFLATDLFARLA